jgi:16S rRNA (adenine1518-N6/adenine1519-N6)-dimethyltransferase
MMYRPSELKAFLESQGLRAKKGLSQNFLIDGNIIQKIVKTAEVSSTDFVIEIGPGPGALTEGLLATGAQVLAIEMDPLFAKALERLQTKDNRLEIAQADILSFPLIDFLRKHPGKKSKVVANLPYHITTPILTLLLPLSEHIESLTLMVQKEFAQRMASKKGTSDYSSLSVFLQFYASVSKSFIVKPSCFYPAPKVDSAVVHCKLHPPLLPGQEEGFFQLTRTAFGQRRKTLRSTLKKVYNIQKLEQVLAEAHLENARPEELSIDEFLWLYEKLRYSNNSPPVPKDPSMPSQAPSDPKAPS